MEILQNAWQWFSDLPIWIIAVSVMVWITLWIILYKKLGGTNPYDDNKSRKIIGHWIAHLIGASPIIIFCWIWLSPDSVGEIVSPDGDGVVSWLKAHMWQLLWDIIIAVVFIVFAGKSYKVKFIQEKHVRNTNNDQLTAFLSKPHWFGVISALGVGMFLILGGWWYTLVIPAFLLGTVYIVPLRIIMRATFAQEAILSDPEVKITKEGMKFGRSLVLLTNGLKITWLFASWVPGVAFVLFDHAKDTHEEKTSYLRTKTKPETTAAAADNPEIPIAGAPLSYEYWLECWFIASPKIFLGLSDRYRANPWEQVDEVIEGFLNEVSATMHVQQAMDFWIVSSNDNDGSELQPGQLDIANSAFDVLQARVMRKIGLLTASFRISDHNPTKAVQDHQERLNLIKLEEEGNKRQQAANKEAGKARAALAKSFAEELESTPNAWKADERITRRVAAEKAGTVIIGDTKPTVDANK